MHCPATASEPLVLASPTALFQSQTQEDENPKEGFRVVRVCQNNSEGFRVLGL